MNTEFLVIGGGGFIGSNIVKTLLEDQHSVRVFDNFSTGRKTNLAPFLSNIELIEGDIRDPETTKNAVQGVRNILLLAALPSVVRSVEDPMSSHDVNVTGTLNVLCAARDAGVDRLVFSSSSSVYGNSPTLPKYEKMTPWPLSPYAANKLVGEHYARLFYELYALKTWSLRYFNVYGPRQNPKSQYAAVIPLFIQAIQENRAPTIEGDGEQTRDFTFVEDVARANLACCSAPEESAGATYNAAGGGRTSINELAYAIAKISGKDINPEYVATRKGDVRDSQAAPDLALTTLNWKALVSLQEGLEKTIEWFNP